MLRLLYGNAPLAPSQLADRMAMTRGAISKLADRMIAKGLIRREASSKDGRGQFLSLTEAGRALAPDLAALADRNDAECFAHLTAHERVLFQGILTKTITHLGIAATRICYLPDGDSILHETHSVAAPMGTVFDVRAIRAAIVEAQVNGPDYSYLGF